MIPAHLLSKVSSKNWLWFVYWAFSYNFLSLCIIYYHHSLSYLLPFLSIIVKQASYAWSRGQFWIRSSFLQRIPFTKLIIIWFVFCLSQILLLCVFFKNFWSSTKIKKLKLQRTWRMVLFNIKTDNFPPLLQLVYSLSEFLSSVSEWLPALQNLEKPGKIIAAVTIMDLNQGPACSPHSCCCSCQCSSGDGDGDDDGDGNGDDDSDDYATLLVMLMLMVNLDLQSSKLVQLPI